MPPRFFTVIALLLMGVSTYSWASVSLSPSTSQPAGKAIHYLQETGNQPYSLTEAIARFERDEGIQQSGDSLSLGIGVAPVWLKLPVQQPIANSEIRYRLAIETPWLDYIDAYIVHDEVVLRHVRGGDGIPFHLRPMPYRYFAFESAYEQGFTEIYIRVESAGPMALPVRIAAIEQALKRDISSAYQYGALYGFMAALALYNFVLFVFIRQREYGLYALYLIGFVLNSLSYTGQIHTVFTPDYGPYLQDWTDIFLMITYSIAGLHFARTLLNTKDYAPVLDAVTRWITLLIPAGMLVSALFNNLFTALILAFILNSGFAILFVLLGIAAVKAAISAAKLFLMSSAVAATCIAISTLAVAGALPLNDLTFKLIEIGMAFEGLFLAVILAQRFRLAQREKLIAEQYAKTDPMTKLNNRRGFEDMSDLLWSNSVRENHDLSLMLIDVDHFKMINDAYGHDEGDQVLCKIARCLEENARSSDLLARWGGEEFVLLLPETDLGSALLQAERLRCSIENLDIACPRGPCVTASMGVVGTQKGRYLGKDLQEITIKRLLKDADSALYNAKNQGRNRAVGISAVA